jgi:hypothetical protein
MEPEVPAESEVSSEQVVTVDPEMSTELLISSEQAEWSESEYLLDYDDSSLDYEDANDIKKETWRDWIDKARQAGVPNRVLATIVTSDFEKRQQEQQEDLEKQFKEGKITMEEMNLAHLKQEIELENEMREALGEEGFLEWDMARELADVEMHYPGLTDEQARQVYDIHKQLTQSRRELEAAKINKEIDQNTFEKQCEMAQAKYDQEFWELMGYEHNNPLGGDLTAQMKRALDDLNVTNEQFEAVRTVENDIADQQARMMQQSYSEAIDVKKMERDQQALRESGNQQVKEILGEEAFDYYQKQQDSRYLDMMDYADDWQLSGEDIEYVYEMLKYKEDIKRDSQLNESGTPANGEIEVDVEQVSNEVTQDLRDYLGPERFALLENNGIFQSE